MQQQNQKADDIGDSKKGQEKTELSDILETMTESENSVLDSLIEENQGIFLYNLIQDFNLLKDSGWWFSITPIAASDGTLLARFTIAPPEGFELEFSEEGDTKIVSVKKSV